MHYRCNRTLYQNITQKCRGKRTALFDPHSHLKGIIMFYNLPLYINMQALNSLYNMRIKVVMIAKNLHQAILRDSIKGLFQIYII